MNKPDDGNPPGWTTELVPPSLEPEDAPDVTIEQPDGYVYHYTTPAGLIGIVGSKDDTNTSSQELTFFASDILQMNDMSELVFGLEIIQELLEQLGDNPKYASFIQRWGPVFERYLGPLTIETLEAEPRPCLCAVSFTTDGDLLSQWMTYGAGGGFAIGLEPRTLREGSYIGRTRDGDKHTFKSDLRQVHYGDNARDHMEKAAIFTDGGILALRLLTGLQKVAAAISALGSRGPQSQSPPDALERAMAALAIRLSAQCKHSAFSAEKEWRLLIGGGADGDIAELLSGHYPPEFRASGTRLLAYRRFTVGPVDGGPVIRELVVGPSSDQALLVHAAQQLLIANGHDPSVVRASTIPYRGW